MAGVVQLPGVENIQRARLGRDPGVQVADTSAVGDALENIGEFVQGATAEILETRRATETTRATAGATQELNEFLFEMESDTDYGTQDERLQTKAKEIRDKHAQGMQSNIARGAFETDFDTALGGHRIDVARKARDGVFNRAEAELDVSLAALSRQIAATDDPIRRAELLSTGRKSILDLAVVGAIEDTDAVNLDQKFRSSVDENDARAMILADPEAAEVALGGADAFPDLTEDKRLTLFARAQTQAEALRREEVRKAEKAERDQEKAVGEEQDAEFAVAIDRIFEGVLTDRDLDRMRETRQISPQDYVTARRLMDAESVVDDDPFVVQSFTDMADDGRLTNRDVINAFSSRMITQTTMNRFLGDIESDPDDFNTKEQLRMLKENVGGVSGAAAILNEDQTRKVNDAVQEFRDRTRGQGREDPREVREDIESRAAQPRKLNTFPRPVMMVSPTRDIRDIDLEQTRAATDDALANGTISEDVFLREDRLLDDLEEAMRGRR